MHPAHACTISAERFYLEYHGHTVRDLEVLLRHLRSNSERLIWTAGDSSLDNKYWFSDTGPAVNGYQEVLRPPRMKQDITYWLNVYAVHSARHGPSTHNRKTAAINAAVEATTLNERSFQLREQDIFLRDHIHSEDVLVVSVGGNDVALCPSPCTIASMAGLVCCCPIQCIQSGFSCGVVPADDYCWGCGPSFFSCACAVPPCLGYLRHLFGVRLGRYIEKLTSQTRPQKILICMIYFPDEAVDPGWAGPALRALGYDENPTKLQSIITKGFQEAVAKINIPGSQVIPVPLFHVLDGKNTNDYVQRVEPSPEGGRKIAEYLWDIITKDRQPTTASSCASPPVAGSYIRDRD